jgi:hypothetical protein
VKRARSRKKHWKYKNLLLIAVGVTIGIILASNAAFHAWLLSLGSMSYAGIFIAGVLFDSTFTVATGIVILTVLAARYSPLEVTAVSTLGAIAGDYLIFRFVRSTLLAEIKPLYKKFGGNHLTHLFHTKYFSWSLPVIGALIIASPLPDELGVTLLGFSTIKTYQLVAISCVMNFSGIFLLTHVGKLV